ncbi:hypothetical protein MtrunA17_Chr7g0262431 [Medicago truncatula]|uniref:Uncharacterized protein n=1 Tax=Medicago truncatula TaxID=3880 RepID=A0A396H6D2_MEDTR|nr:hypothetical protein MtrunA17_Chr7g0262431 [Medicago truncatula]
MHQQILHPLQPVNKPNSSKTENSNNGPWLNFCSVPDSSET